jgi:hypothetical protein
LSIWFGISSIFPPARGLGQEKSPQKSGTDLSAFQSINPNLDAAQNEIQKMIESGTQRHSAPAVPRSHRRTKE